MIIIEKNVSYIYKFIYNNKVFNLIPTIMPLVKHTQKFAIKPFK